LVNAVLPSKFIPFFFVIEKTRGKGPKSGKPKIKVAETRGEMPGKYIEN